MINTRHHILTIAGQLFAERGYELVGINEIIEKSAIAKATFYSHFKSKERLCAEWLEGEAAQSAAAAAALLKHPSKGIDKVGTKFDSLRKYCRSSDFRGCPFSITASMTAPSSAVRDVIAEYKASSRSFWQALAREIRTEAVGAKQLGDTLFLLYSGAVTEAQNCRQTWPVDAAKAAALQLCRLC